jgi:hypothetical protein
MAATPLEKLLVEVVGSISTGPFITQDNYGIKLAHQRSLSDDT